MLGSTFSQSNGFMIDKDGKKWRITEVSDVIKYLGTIDTPTELKLVLWLNNEAREGERYQRTSKGYTVISEYDNSIDNFGECGHFVYRLKVSKKGKITEKKLLQKTASKYGCITADQGEVMKIFKIMLLMALIFTMSTQYMVAASMTMVKKYKPLKVNEGRKLFSLKQAMLDDVHLAKQVKYFDIKQYDAFGKYVTGWSFDMAAYKKLSNKEKKKIRSVKGKKLRGSFWKLSLNDGTFNGFYNLHYLDKYAKVHSINSRKELLSFLGTVDTPAELSMLFLDHSYGKIRYRKMGNVYNIRINDIYYPDCDGCGEPACTVFVRQMILDNRGDILLNRQVSEKSFKSEKKCEKF